MKDQGLDAGGVGGGGRRCKSLSKRIPQEMEFVERHVGVATVSPREDQGKGQVAQVVQEQIGESGFAGGTVGRDVLYERHDFAPRDVLVGVREQVACACAVHFRCCRHGDLLRVGETVTIFWLALS